MEYIQKKLGEHHNTEVQYNKDVKKFRENAAEWLWEFSILR